MRLIRNGEPLGHYHGKHYTEYVETIKTLKRNGDNSEAIRLLIALLPVVEDEGCIHKVTAPWYYDQLAILFRKLKDYDAEVELLEHYMTIQKGNPTRHAALVKRLGRARALQATNAH